MRSLRPLGFALFFLALFELGLRAACGPDPRVLRDPLHPFGCFADGEHERLLRDRAAAGGRREGIDVVLLGDSVLASTDNADGERLRDALSQALPAALTEALGGDGVRAPQVRVYTLAEGGARVTDQYAALRRLAAGLAALPEPARRRGLAIVLSSNVLFHSQRHRQPALAFPCLGDWLDEPELRARLGLPAHAGEGLLDRIERHLTAALTRHLYLFQQRRRISERLFGSDGLPPRQALRERLVTCLRALHGSPRPSGAAAGDAVMRNRPWSERGLKPAHFRAHYDLVPPQSPEATSELASAHLARYLSLHPELPVTVVEIAQNHALVGQWTATPAYSALQDRLAARYTAAGARVLRLDRHPSLRSVDFLDQDHLSAEGNRRLAALLAAELAPRLAASLSPPERAARPAR